MRSIFEEINYWAIALQETPMDDLSNKKFDSEWFAKNPGPTTPKEEPEIENKETEEVTKFATSPEVYRKSRFRKGLGLI